jgi:hypothetical protein
MKALKLRRVDKTGVKIALSLFVFLWSLRFFPPVPCTVHFKLLRNEWAYISYGLSATRITDGDEYSRLFPNYGSHSGGCVIGLNAPRYRWVRYCPKCRAAFDKWNRGEDVE